MPSLRPKTVPKPATSSRQAPNALDDLESALKSHAPADIDLSDVGSNPPPPASKPTQSAPLSAVMRRPSHALRRPATPKKLPPIKPPMPTPQAGVGKGSTVHGAKLGLSGLFNDSLPEREINERSTLGVPTDDLSAFERLDTAMREAQGLSGPVSDFPSSLPDPEVRDDGPAEPLWGDGEIFSDELSPFAMSREDTGSRTAVPIDDSYHDAAASMGDPSTESPFTEPIVTDQSYTDDGPTELDALPLDESWHDGELDAELGWAPGDASRHTQPIGDDDAPALSIQFDEFDQSGAFLSVDDGKTTEEVEPTDLLPDLDDDLLDVPIVIGGDDDDNGEETREVSFDEYDSSGLFASVPDPDAAPQDTELDLEIDLDLDDSDPASTPETVSPPPPPKEHAPPTDDATAEPPPLSAEASEDEETEQQKRARTVPSERKGIEPFPAHMRAQRASSEVKRTEPAKAPVVADTPPTIEVDSSAYIPSESSTSIRRPGARVESKPQTPAPKPKNPAELPGGAAFSFGLLVVVIAIVVLMAFAFGML